jgi:hypothetical protein
MWEEYMERKKREEEEIRESIEFVQLYRFVPKQQHTQQHTMNTGGQTSSSLNASNK